MPRSRAKPPLRHERQIAKPPVTMRCMNEDFGKLVLRLSLGILILLHGIAKITGGVGFLTPMLKGIGLPAWFAYGVYVGEIIAPIMVIMGLFMRTGAFLIFVNMIFAIVLAHRAELLQFTKTGGWALELQGMFLFVAFALIFLGPGRYAFTRRFLSAPPARVHAARFQLTVCA
jgi:putative oxidoreductase